MKKILVPTDFSPVADNALRYAIEIATVFKSKIYLYHFFSYDRFNFDLNLPKDKQPYVKELERSMKRTKLKFDDKIKEKGLSIKTYVREGSIFSLFKTKVQEYEIDMIVLGSKGTSGMTKFFFGNIAASALELAEVPVLVVPPDHDFTQLQHIVLAMDQIKVPPNVLSSLQKLTSEFGSKVTILHVKANVKKGTDKVPDLGLEGVETTFREVQRSKSINNTINEFIRKEPCELLCMVRRKKGFFEKLFKKSITEVQVFNNQVPLLVLPEV